MLLEDAVRTAWLMPGATTALRLLPARAGALVTASWPALALRLGMLDGALQYDRVGLQGGGSHLQGSPRLDALRSSISANKKRPAPNKKAFA